MTPEAGPEFAPTAPEVAPVAVRLDRWPELGHGDGSEHVLVALGSKSAELLEAGGGVLSTGVGGAGHVTALVEVDPIGPEVAARVRGSLGANCEVLSASNPLAFDRLAAAVLEPERFAGVRTHDAVQVRDAFRFLFDLHEGAKTPGGHPVGIDRRATFQLLDHMHAAVALSRSADVGVALAEAERLGVRHLVRQSGSSLEPSALARLYQSVVLRQRSITPLASMANLLRRCRYESEAAQLEDLVQHWVDHRLWSLNLVPEMNAHDDRHVEQVDRLAAELVAPLQLRNAVSVRELQLLSTAAWLHDWGHVGGRLGTWQVDDPKHVRYMHGLLTQRLLAGPDHAGLHALPDDWSDAVGVLCAHHQGWTSFDDSRPSTGSQAAAFERRLRHRPPSLAAEADSLGGLDRAQLLVALLRVADAADVGRHRVRDHCAKQDFLHLRLSQQAFRTLDILKQQPSLESQYRDAVTELASAPKLAMRDRTMYELLRTAQDPLLDELVDYIDFARIQSDHYANHSQVERVRFELVNRHGEPARVTARVIPAPGTHPRKARDIVAEHIRAEMDRGSGSRTVRTVLLEHGIDYVGAEPSDF